MSLDIGDQIRDAIGAILDLAPGDDDPAGRRFSGGKREPNQPATRWLVVVAAVCLVLGGLVAAAMLRTADTSTTPVTLDTESVVTTTAHATTSTAPAEQPSSTTTPVISGPTYTPGQPVWPPELIDPGAAWQTIVSRGIDAVTAKCMADRGFQYLHIPEDPIVVMPVIKDADYRRQYGYGSPPQQSDTAAWERYTNQDHDPAFHAALYGDESTAQVGGCQKVAYLTIYPPDGVAVPPENTAFNQSVTFFFAAQGVGGESRLTNAVMADALRDWQACMATAGITATAPAELESMAAQRPEAHPHQPTAEEIDVALKDWACQQSTHYVDRWYGTLQTLTAEFAAEHQQMIDSIRAWLDATEARAAEASRSATDAARGSPHP